MVNHHRKSMKSQQHWCGGWWRWVNNNQSRDHTCKTCVGMFEGHHSRTLSRVRSFALRLFRMFHERKFISRRGSRATHVLVSRLPPKTAEVHQIRSEGTLRSSSFVLRWSEPAIRQRLLPECRAMAWEMSSNVPRRPTHNSWRHNNSLRRVSKASVIINCFKS